MATHSSQENLSLPVAIIIGSVIIGGSIIFTSTRAPASTAQNIAQAPAAPAQQAVQPSADRAADVKAVKLNSPIIGSATAPVVIAYWYDYQCSYCNKFESESMSNIVKDYVKTGKIRVVFKSLQFLSPDSTALGIAERAVWEVAPSKFYDWHQAVIMNQGKGGSGWATKEGILAITTQVLGKTSADRVMALTVSKADIYKQAIDADKAEGSTFGARSTPTIIIDKQLIVGARPYSEIKAAIDAIIK